LALPEIEPQFSCLSARSPSLYRLSYPGSQKAGEIQEKESKNLKYKNLTEYLKK
jgi:hypothetical protein